MTEAHPLHWPSGWPRTARRQSSRFDTGLADAIQGVLRELRLLNAKHVVISTNIPTRLDGLPYANKRPSSDDPGVAVYFSLDGKSQCIPCDRWATVADNVQAVRKTIEALRGLERWGAKQMVDAAFAGFAALPAPEAARHWSEILGVPKTAGPDEIVAAFRVKAKHAHPDHGGSDADMAELIKARQDALGGADA